MDDSKSDLSSTIPKTEMHNPLIGRLPKGNAFSSSISHLSLSAVFWSLPVLLAWLQWLATSFSMEHIHYEELAESIRNVYWLEHRLVYGICTNVGWYGTLLVTYKLFGFSLFEAKYVRLGLHLLGLFCAADLLRRIVGIGRAIVPLLVIGLSPTLLYFNTIETSYGTDLPYAAICLWLLYSICFCSLWDALRCFLFGAIAMIAAMSYPTFLLYLPSFTLISIWTWKTKSTMQRPSRKLRYLALGLAGFLFPLIAAILFLKTPQLLIYDRVTRSGLFRGAGQFGFDVASFKQSLITPLHDLFVRGNSYYFGLGQPDYSGMLAAVSLVCIGLTTSYLVAKREVNRLVLSAIVFLLLTNLILPNLEIRGVPGIRRCTGLLAASFALFTLAWAFYTHATFRNSRLGRLGILLCLLLPVSYALKYRSLLLDIARANGEPEPADYTVEDTPTGPKISFSPGASVVWFSAKQNATDSLDQFLRITDEGLQLQSLDEKNEPAPGCYAEIYAALAGYRLWNHLPDKEIRAWDWKSKTTITLRPSLWSDYYFPY